MERQLTYSAIVEGRKILICEVLEIKENREAYTFVGKKGIKLAILPKEKCSLILLKREF